MLKKFWKSQYFRGISILASGSFVAQLVTISASPILTRLYQPESFAILALFIAIVSTLVPAAAGRYEIAIVVSGSEKKSEQLLGLSLWVAIMYTLMVTIILILFYQPVLDLMSAHQLSGWIYLVPITLLMSVIIIIVRYYANHKQDYKVISKIVLIQAVLTTSINIVLGILDIEKFGLLIGNVVGIVITAVISLLLCKKTFNLKKLAWNKKKYFLAKKYKDFPLYNAPTSLLDGLAVALPVFMLAKYYPEAIVGYYALLVRVAHAPLSLFSSSISQVHLKKTSDLVKANKNITKYLFTVTGVLVSIVMFPTAILITYAEEIFSWVFGETWRMAGQLLSILMPALALRFVVSTVSPLLGATGHNKVSAIWKISSLVVTFIMFIGFAPSLTVMEIFIAMVITDLILYLSYYLVIIYAAMNPVGYR
jgi:O-antigen/teichoic acid export membrane protein